MSNVERKKRSTLAPHDWDVQALLDFLNLDLSAQIDVDRLSGDLSTLIGDLYPSGKVDRLELEKVQAELQADIEGIAAFPENRFRPSDRRRAGAATERKLRDLCGKLNEMRFASRFNAVILLPTVKTSAAHGGVIKRPYGRFFIDSSYLYFVELPSARLRLYAIVADILSSGLLGRFRRCRLCRIFCIPEDQRLTDCSHKHTQMFHNTAARRRARR